MSAEVTLSELNKKYAMHTELGFVIIENKKKKNRKSVSYIDVAKFHNTLANKFTRVKGRKVPLSREWIQWEGRRDCDEIVLDPTNKHKPDQVNLWAGFGIDPSPDGDWNLFLNFMLDVICAGNMGYLKYLLSWLADMIQNPENKKGTAVVLVGGQGIGKSFFAEQVSKLFGQHSITISSARHLVGNFNAHMEDKIFVFFDEAEGVKSFSAQAMLKEAITGRTRVVEPKGKNPFVVANITRFLLSSNTLSGVIRASGDERRYFVLEVIDAHQNDTEYFAKIEQQLENGGLEKMMYDLMNFKINIDLRIVPKTKALLRQKVHSMNKAEKWWLSTLYKGTVDGELDIWSQPVPSYRLAQSYMAFSGTDSQRAAEMAVSKALGKLCSRHSKIKLHESLGSETRVWFYKFPPIQLCREEVEEFLGHELYEKPQSQIGQKSSAEMNREIVNVIRPYLPVQPKEVAANE